MISRFKIQNFKSLKDIDLSFSNLNVLTGMNGMGKSSVIQALFLLRNSFFNEGYFQYLRLNNKDLPLGKGFDILYQNAKSDMINFSIDFSSINMFPTLEFEYQIQIDKDFLKMKEEKYKLFDNTFRNDYLEYEVLFNKKFQFLNSNLIGPKNLHIRDDYEVNEFQNIGVHGEYTVHFLSIYGNRRKVESHLIHKKLKSDSLKSNVEAWLSEISPGVRLNIATVPGDTGLILNYQFEVGREMSNSFSPINVGFGINYAIPIITALLTAENDKLIIIESPEVYLHPKGQSKIGELAALAAQTGAQIIIETHSDHVINGIRVATKQKKILPENIKMYYFDRNYDNDEHYSYVSEMKIDSDGRLDYWPEGFMDEWDKNLMELI